MGTALVPLDTLADGIDACFDKAAQYEGKANDFRISAGQMLIEARQRVEAGDGASRVAKLQA
jgi:hypothetical protein